MRRRFFGKMHYIDRVGYVLDENNEKAIAIYRVCKSRKGGSIRAIYISPNLDKEQRIELLNEMNMLVMD